MSERMQEIEGVINLIHELCARYEITLESHNHKGTDMVVIKDGKTDKNFILLY